MRLFSYCIILVCILAACNEPVKEIYSEYKQVEENIVALTGGILSTSDSVKLTIPPNALPSDGLVFLGKTGLEPTEVPNSDIEIINDPITIRFPTGSILKPIQLRLPVPPAFIDPDNTLLLLYNGSTYYPMNYTVDGSVIHVTIDRIDWDVTENKDAHITSELIILFARYKQSVPQKEMGLKKVVLNKETKEVSYETPTASASSRVLLLVHGWTGSPEKWNDFLPWFISDNNLPYTEIWTFGYNSSWSINHNGELLSQLLRTHTNGVQIDVVAHSMGGLVSRAMIENFNGEQYINRLIALGSPHQGSPLAAFRYVIGALIAEDNSDDTFIYNYTTQGFRDLDTSSAFIRQMKQLKEPPLPYYTIAVTNDPDRSVFSQVSSNQILEGPDDGIVSVSSAYGVKGAVSPGHEIQLPVAWAHMEMLKDSAVFEQVVDYLKLF